jgi:ubiquitin carboxyl-terminal hydrolase 34
MSSSDLKYLTIQLVVDWINENRVFESLYKESGNVYLIQRSSEFLKFMLEEKLVSMEQLKMILGKFKQCEQEEK